jgi:sulfate transport system permease protein
MSGALAAPLPSGAAAPSSSRGGSRKVLPGFGLTLGFTVFYLCLIVLIPLSALVLKTSRCRGTSSGWR